MYDVIVVGARAAGSPTAMLLARKGHKVLVVDRATFPSDTMSTHYIHQPGVAALKRWGLLDRVLATGCPTFTTGIIDAGPFTLTGWGPAVDGVPFAFAPRRTVLDKILVDAAAEAGAEVREGFSIQEMLMDGDTVTGIRGRAADGTPVTERARLVIGADGLHSLVARAVEAPKYHERPALTCGYYSYFSGMAEASANLYPREGMGAITYPTNDGLSLVIVVWKHEMFHTVRADIEGSVFAALDAISPELAARVRAGRREARWTGTADLPNFFRRPYGPGWALVGDAGYHKDPITGYGITDAFRDVEFLADAAHAGLSGHAAMSEALAGYEARRNEVAMPIYELICQMASLTTPPEMQALLFALQGNQPEIDRFIGVLDGTVSMMDFFSPENMGRIMAAAERRAA